MNVIPLPVRGEIAVAPAIDAWESQPDLPGSCLLAALPGTDQRLLRPHLQSVEFLQDEVLGWGAPEQAFCYFIERGLIAVITRVGTEQRPIEVGMVGRAGMVGISTLFGMDVAPHTGIALTEGRALRIEADLLRSATATSERLRELLMRYAYARVAELMQISGCNACHTLEQRLSRWMLTASARLGASNIEVTHRRLSEFLGVRRAGVTLALHVLEGSGAIRSTRGRIDIRDRARLEALSCGCDRIMQTPFVTVLAVPGQSKLPASASVAPNGPPVA